jgi:hypothetical protein
MVAGLGAVDGVVLGGVHDGQDACELERVSKGLRARGVVPVANHVTRRPVPRRGDGRCRGEREHGGAADDEAIHARQLRAM